MAAATAATTAPTTTPMIRPLLGSGRIFFQDKVRKGNFFHFNFSNKGEKLVPNADEPSNLVKRRFNSMEEIESLFKSEKPVTQKVFSMAYGRKVICSRLALPLIVSFNPDTQSISFEGRYETTTEDRIHPKRLAKSQRECMDEVSPDEQSAYSGS